MDRRILFVLALVGAGLATWLRPFPFALATLPNVPGMTVGDFLAWLGSEAVVGVAIAWIFGYLHVPLNISKYAAPIVVAVVGAAIASVAKIVPTNVLGETVWQFLLSLFGIGTSLAAMGVGARAYAFLLHALGAKADRVKAVACPDGED